MQRRLAELDLREHQDKILPFLALVISAVVGLSVVAFVALTEKMGKVLLTAGAAQRLASPLLGSLVGGWLLFKFFPEARGSGIPQTRVALVLRNGVIGLRTVVGKFLCSSISLGSGVALGREGPSVHIGAGIASFAGRRLGLGEEHLKALIPVGTAAAVAAAFNTPLAAVLFTLEEILADLHARVVGSVVIGAATSWIVLRLILGDEPLFHVPAYQLVHPAEFFVYALLGGLGGLVSTAFVKLLLWQRKAFLKTPRKWVPFTPAVGGLTVGVLALLAPGVIGVGYNLVSDALNGQLALRMMLLLLVLKLIATATSYSSGNAGGIFGPALFIGAMLGGAVGQVAHTLAPDSTGNAGAYALVGMGAAFAGIVRTPMTSVIMIFEVTRDYTIIVPLMIANLCSYLLAQRLHRTPIYEALSHQDGIVMPSAEHRLEPLTVERAMRVSSVSEEAMAGPIDGLHAYPDDPLDSALQRMGTAGIDELPVVSRVGARRIGSISVQDALAAYTKLSSTEDQTKTAITIRAWLPALAAFTVAAVLLASGLLFWQRSRRSEIGLQAYKTGQEMMKQGRIDEAVAEFRSALAHTPQDVRIRAALGLALVRSGHFNEAEAYLSAVAKIEPQNGPVWMGLAQIASASGDTQRALRLTKQALSKEWAESEEPQRRRAQLDYAALLLSSGRRSEALSRLSLIIAERGDDPVIAKQAAEMIKSKGSAEEAEQAYTVLARHFPADASIWVALGDLKLAQRKALLALDAYRRAAALDPEDADARRSAAHVEQILALDPNLRGLSTKERSRRWDEILTRIEAAATACGFNPGPALNKRPAGVGSVQARMPAALEIWRSLRDPCRKDPALTYIMATTQ